MGASNFQEERFQRQLDAHERRLSALERTRCPDPGEGAVSMADAAIKRLEEAEKRARSAETELAQLEKSGRIAPPRPACDERCVGRGRPDAGCDLPDADGPHTQIECSDEAGWVCDGTGPAHRAPDPAPAVTREEVVEALRGLSIARWPGPTQPFVQTPCWCLQIGKEEQFCQGQPECLAARALLARIDAEGGPRV